MNFYFHVNGDSIGKVLFPTAKHVAFILSNHCFAYLMILVIKLQREPARHVMGIFNHLIQLSPEFMTWSI